MDQRNLLPRSIFEYDDDAAKKPFFIPQREPALKKKLIIMT